MKKGWFKNKFSRKFWVALIILLIMLIVFSFFLSIRLNENFLLKYSEDKKLEKSTIEKISVLQKTLLAIGFSLFTPLFLLIFFKNPIKLLIKKYEHPLKILLLFFATLIALFLISEIILRIILYDKTTGRDIGATAAFNHKYVKLNNEGFRDAEFNIEKGNKTRIIGLGDSYMYGWGIKNVEDSYLRILEKKLKENGNYEVFNFGLPGKNTEDELKILKEKALKYNPDIIIIGYSTNDIKNVDKNIEKYDWTAINVPFNFWLRNSIYTFFYLELQLNQFLETFGDKKSAWEHDIMYVNSEINRKYNSKIFDELVEITNERNITVLIVVFPLLIDLENYPLYQIHDFAKEMAEKHNFYYLDLTDVYSKYEEKELVLNRYDPHINKLGHKLAGESILNKLKEENLVSRKP